MLRTLKKLTNNCSCRPWSAKSVFITGTDTNVGKTYIACKIAEKLSACGVDVGVMKPLSTGDRNDAKKLIKSANVKDDINLVNPIHLKYPLAPYISAKLEKKNINLQKIFDAYKKLSKKHKFLLIEGIGGVLVPIKEKYFVLDLIKDLGLPVIIVAHSGLGTINHTLMTIEILQRKKIKILGVILNGLKSKGLAEKTNPKIIQEFSGIPIIDIDDIQNFI